MGRPTITLRQATEKAHAIAHFGRPRRRAAVGRAGLCGKHRPTAQVQEKLIKTSLLTFNDANLTGNYAVMHAKLAKPFRDKFSPDQLKKAFKKLHRPENRPRAYRSEAAGRHHRNEDRRPRRAAAARLF
jgi:hypothetical protein